MDVSSNAVEACLAVIRENRKSFSFRCASEGLCWQSNTKMNCSAETHPPIQDVRHMYVKLLNGFRELRNTRVQFDARLEVYLHSSIQAMFCSRKPNGRPFLYHGETTMGAGTEL